MTTDERRLTDEMARIGAADYDAVAAEAGVIRYGYACEPGGAVTRRTLARLGLRSPWRSGSGSLLTALAVDLCAAIAAERRAKRRPLTEGQKDAARRRASAARQRRVAAREELAESLGLLPDSRTFAAYMRDEITEEEARRIGRITSDRHENTDYDDRLAAGMDRDTARATMERI